MAAAAAASAAKADDGAIDRRSSGYKSWKKKYRKMRIVFDQKMHQGEDLRRQEDKASATVKRLAIENDRLLDILLEVNNSPQIPPERRVDVTLAPPANATAPVLAMDARQAVLQGDKALKRLEQLLSDVPHSSYGTAKELHSPLVADLVTADGDALPANFLSADDIDNYMFAIDLTLDPDAQLPTLAPRAHLQAHSVLHPHLKNPTSVTSWLRKHARNIFLQDGESGAADGTYDVDGGPSGAGTSASASAAGVAASSATGSAIGGHQTPLGRRPRGAHKADRGISRGGRGKRATARLAAERPGDDASMDEDAVSGATPVGRSKRKRDDDPGYRPGGSSNRPAKKKRKSDLDGSTPIVRRSKKEASAAAWGAGTAAGTGGSNLGD